MADVLMFPAPRLTPAASTAWQSAGWVQATGRENDVVPAVDEVEVTGVTMMVKYTMGPTRAYCPVIAGAPPTFARLVGVELHGVSATVSDRAALVIWDPFIW